jgi:hypothetical protein
LRECAQVPVALCLGQCADASFDQLRAELKCTIGARISGGVECPITRLNYPARLLTAGE